MAERPTRTGQQIIVRAIRNILLGAALFTAIAFLADYAVLRIRILANKKPYGTVTVRPIYAVPKKNHSTEFLVGDTRDQTCVNALFPHMDSLPCWYLARHKEQQINM
ncbi:MAG: hypothetical protein M3Y72_18160 [Acidobacteriota bacterium]|nr:hypothetical protein [Acidobacteriota bacterium]